jgi:Protein of unknown function (DUF3551)
MRCGRSLAAAMAVAATITLAATGARADDQWCGYASGDKSVIECGYSSVAQCQSAVGKGGMCFVDPEYALNSKRTTPFSRHPEVAAQRPSKGDGLDASAVSFEARCARASG